MIESSNLPIPISFFWYPRILYLYINIYISISYKIFRKGYILKLYNWNWKTGRFWLLCSLTFLYQAIKCPEEFVAHGHRIAHHVETLSCLYRLEVRAMSSAALQYVKGQIVYRSLNFLGKRLIVRHDFGCCSSEQAPISFGIYIRIYPQSTWRPGRGK